jgi:hypothetical protein
MAIPQGTVRDFDEVTRAGSLFLDDGSVLTFGSGAFDAGGLRLLRAGQRVRYEADRSGITLVTLVTL